MGSLFEWIYGDQPEDFKKDNWYKQFMHSKDV